MFDLEVEQLDVKTAFLHGTLDEVIYMHQPPGLIKKGDEDKVYLLLKSLYGLKQAPRQWNKRFNDFMRFEGFHGSRFDSCVYFKDTSEGSCIYLLIYVDDMLIISKSMAEIEKLKKSM